MDLACMCVNTKCVYMCVTRCPPSPKHQILLYVCHQMRLYVCHQMRSHVSPNAFICVSPMRLHVCHQTFFNSLN